MADLRINKKKHIFWAEIDRPETKNTIDFKIMELLENLLDEIEQNNNIRVLILSGAGDRFFASGANIEAFSTLKAEKEGLEMAERMSSILNRLESNRFWSLACVNGDTYGGGCELLLAFDFSIASKISTFSFTQASMGLPPGWGGITRLVERVGRSRALEWLASGEEISSDEAFQAGLINRLSITSELRRNTWEWALQLARIPPDLIQELKHGTKFSLENPRNDAFKRERERFAHFWASKDHLDRVEDFLRKKKKKKL
ncbi:enoyl-CoA hydratase/isomerase family protein [Balneolaceae bacterium ANBcel3]|nr:enoyl-CoA hydratase/isomerase family protein [Balneolaceae bacterium ANBcel3]